MAYIRRIKGRGVHGAVTAYGEVLFAPGADVNRFGNRLTQRVRTATAAAAPANKRPRWSHYGPPLKSTITATRQRVAVTKGGARLYSAVGSTAPYSYYVDQGTGEYVGHSAWRAKILPPWTRGGPGLYEHTWKPGGPRGRTVRAVWIKGQKGQGFFETGLKRGYQSVRLRSFQVPGEGYSGVSEAMNLFPRGLEFAGNTPVSPSFITQLEEWRRWRDEAWARREDLIDGKYRAPKTKKSARFNKPKKPTKPKGPSAQEMRNIRARIVAGLSRQGLQVRNVIINKNGTYTALVKGPRDRIFKPIEGRWR